MTSRDVSRSRGRIRTALVSMAVVTAGIATFGLSSSPASASPKPDAVEQARPAPTPGVGIKLPPGGGYSPRAGIRW